MTDRPRAPEPGDDRGTVYDRESTAGMPRWVKLAGIILIVLVLLVVVVLLVGGGEHRPRRHGSGGAGGQAPPSSVKAVHVPPFLAAGSQPAEELPTPRASIDTEAVPSGPRDPGR